MYSSDRILISWENYVCDQICEKGLINATDFATLKRHNSISE